MIIKLDVVNRGNKFGFKKTWIATVDEIPKCDICKGELKIDDFAYFFKELKKFLCLGCEKQQTELDSGLYRFDSRYLVLLKSD